MSEHEHVDLLQRLSVVETCLKSIHENDFPHLQAELMWIKDRLASPRPSWTVATMLTVLSSLCVGLAIKLLSR